MLRRIGLACIVVAVASSSAAWAAPRDERPGPGALVEAFPLDPTGERVKRTTRAEPQGRQEAVRVVPGSEPDASREPTLALAVGIAGGVLLVSGGAVVLRRARRARRRGSRPLSQTGWPSARERILDYGWPVYPDVPVRGRVRTLELPDGEDRSAPPPPAEWRSVA
jgi:hypothetical protein